MGITVVLEDGLAEPTNASSICSERIDAHPNPSRICDSAHPLYPH
jgi:hypothetical protein